MSSTTGTTSAGTSADSSKGSGSGASGGQSATDAGGDKRTAMLGDVGDDDKGGSKKETKGESGKDSTKDQGQKGTDADGKGAADGEIKITLPEGFEVDKAAIEAFMPIAKEAKLTSEQASAIVAFEAKRQAAAIEAAVKDWEKTDDGWLAELKADKEFGGEKLEQTTADVKKALRKFGGEKLAKDLVENGIANLPSLVRAFARIGRGMKEDTSTGGDVDTKGKLGPNEKLRKFYDHPSSRREA